MCPGFRTGLFMTSQGSHAFKESITATGDKRLLLSENVVWQKLWKEVFPHTLGDMFKTAHAQTISLFSELCSGYRNVWEQQHFGWRWQSWWHESIVATAERRQSRSHPVCRDQREHTRWLFYVQLQESTWWLRGQHVLGVSSFNVWMGGRWPAGEDTL